MDILVLVFTYFIHS